MICNKHYRYRLAPLWARLPPTSKATPLLTPFIFFLLFFTTSLFAQDDTCSHLSFDKRGLVTKVYDGDTLKLASGEKIRLIGINTPEMNYDTGSPEPYAKKAKQLLEKLALKKRIGIKYGRDKKDRYKRRLAHAFLLNGKNLQYEILKAGLAFNISIPPNLWNHNCYKNAQKQADRNQLGIWKSPYYKPVQANRITKNKLGYKRVTGKITEVLKTKKTIWIKYTDKMALRISKKDLHYFKNLRPKQLIGKQITASGWISLYKHRYSMRIKHPDAMQIE